MSYCFSSLSFLKFQRGDKIIQVKNKVLLKVWSFLIEIYHFSSLKILL